MERMRLGGSDLEVSRVGLGRNTLGRRVDSGWHATADDLDVLARLPA